MKLFIWVIGASLFCSTLSMHSLNVTDFSCISSIKKSAEITKCSKNGRYISFDLNFLRKNNKWNYHIEIYQKKNGKFVQIFKTPPINWCEFTGGSAKLMNFQKLIIKGIRKSSEQLFHKCPYEGLHTVRNATISNDVIDILPLGTYKVSAFGEDKEDSRMFEMIVTFVLF